jgi:hypothetical protein
MTQWLVFEEWLATTHSPGDTFTSREYAYTTGLDPNDASDHLQAYQRRQRLEIRHNNKGEQIGGPYTAYVLRRLPGTRTNSAVWTFGVRSKDIDKISQTWARDLRYRFMAAVGPDIRRVAAINPRAAKKAENVIETIVDGALKVLVGTIKGLDESGG